MKACIAWFIVSLLSAVVIYLCVANHFVAKLITTVIYCIAWAVLIITYLLIVGPDDHGFPIFLSFILGSVAGQVIVMGVQQVEVHFAALEPFVPMVIIVLFFLLVSIHQAIHWSIGK